MTTLNDALIRFATAVTPTPSPSATAAGIDPELVTPTWVGFAFTFLIAIGTVFLIIDMTRRIRRVRYREEIRERIAAENEQNL
jgi:H+/gluconate symporter-like permease